MIINLYPGQLVDNFHVDVNINETRRIINVNTPALRSGTEITEDIKVAKNQFATISKLNNDDTEVNIKFSPTVQQQKEMAVGSTGTDGSQGIAGQFVVEYDVERDPEGGEVTIEDDYFVHFFAPTELKPIPKHIVFVLDVSGSMRGNRIRQLREAMQVILTKLNNEDYFHLVKFSSGVQVWHEVWKSSNELPQPYLATEDNIQKVQNIVKQLSSGGGTNIYDALAGALQLTNKGVAHSTEIQPMIVFLTDGKTSNYDKILNMVNSNNVGKKAAIFSVSFGYGANQAFLESVASNNLGFMKLIYDGADASLQLEDFYKEISTPLLTNVKFTYPGQVSNVTNNKFDILFEGSEFAVAGKLTYSSNKFVNVNGRSSIGIQEFIPNYFVINSEPYKKTKYASIERIWAYMRIKQLLNKKYEITNIETNRSPQEEALAIALKYSFVTPVSTIDVVQFNSTEDYDDDTCSEPDFSQQLLKNPIKPILLLLPNIVICGPLPDATTESLLIVGTDQASSEQTLKDPRLPELKSMHVTANIRNRYARTIVETKYLNPEDQAQEATFTITLPDTAFISGFVMEIGGKKYEAYVREKEEAKKEYQQAVDRGQSAGHVEMSARDSKTFTVSVNVEPLNKILFTLTYEQLLKRKHGKYEMVVNLQPGQLVDDFNIDVNINETRQIVDINAPALRSGNEIVESTKVAKNQFATISKLNDDETEVNIHFSPSIQQQKEMMVGTKGADENKGISGQFVVEYDVERDPAGGEVIIDDGYFVHFFAPSDLQPIPKHIVFVLDVSGSMSGKKMKQLRDAMKVILGELNNEDHFHLVKFSSGVQIWNEEWKNVENPTEFELPPSYLATENNIKKVQGVVQKMSDEGMTNIYDALAVALRLTSKGISSNENEIHERQPIIVFLTDGQANQGISDSAEILKMINSKNDGNKAAIFTLSFGEYANKNFLKNVASKNLGFMRTIYEAADASLQLEDFYREISSPLLTNVNFIYADQISNVTKNKFDILFKGSEFVVAGKLTDSSDKFVSVEGRTSNGTHRFVPKYFPIIKRPKLEPKPEQKKEYGNLERLWAYMTIKQLLDKKYEIVNKDESSSLEKEALAIALKYSFVTPVSSLVVVKPNSTESTETRPAHKKKGQIISGSYNRMLINPTNQRSGFPRAGTSSRHYSVPMLASLPSSSTYSFMRMGGSPARVPTTPTMNIVPITNRQYLRVDSTGNHLISPSIYLQNHLPWIASLQSEPDELTIDNQNYLIGNNGTSVGDKSCQVNTLNLSGNCTLLTACPKIYPTLDSLATYRKYFCILESGSSRYAGVCCIDN